jgi:VanZ family protein
MRSFSKYWLPVLIWLGIMFVGSTDLLSAEQTSRFLVPFLRWLRPDISSEALAQIHFVVRKLAHISEYAILSMLLWRALHVGSSLRINTSFLFVAVWLACGIFAAGDEFHQSFVPSRTAASSDVLIDICGATIGLAICFMISRKHAIAAPINLG